MSGTLKKIRDHIQSIEKMQQFMNAMKLVSASKLRKNQPVLLKYRRYQNQLTRMLCHVLLENDNENFHNQSNVKNPKSACQIVITSNRGLCGHFNNQILKLAEENISTRFSDLFELGLLDIICIGEKGFKYFRKGYPHYSRIKDYSELLHDINADSIVRFCQELYSDYQIKKLDRIDVTYAHFESSGTQRVRTDQWMPILIQHQVGKRTMVPNYHFEPPRKILLNELIPEVLISTFYTFLLESITSEHKARMTAMSKSTQNAGDLISDLKLTYNVARQNAITEELIDIINAAEALR